MGISGPRVEDLSRLKRRWRRTPVLLPRITSGHTQSRAARHLDCRVPSFDDGQILAPRREMIKIRPGGWHRQRLLVQATFRDPGAAEDTHHEMVGSPACRGRRVATDRCPASPALCSRTYRSYRSLCSFGVASQVRGFLQYRLGQVLWHFL